MRKSFLSMRATVSVVVLGICVGGVLVYSKSRVVRTPGVTKVSISSPREIDNPIPGERKKTENLTEDLMEKLVLSIPDVIEPEFIPWEAAAYNVIPSTEGWQSEDLKQLVKEIPVTLEIETEPAEYEALQSRVCELIHLWATQDPDSYIEFFEKGGAVADPERVKKYQAKLKQGKNLDDDLLSDPKSVFREEFVLGYELAPQHAWEGVAPSLSKIRIYQGGELESLQKQVDSRLNNGVINTHLRWQYPRLPKDVATGGNGVKYSEVVLQIRHAKTNKKFPLTFLFFWEPVSAQWLVLESYASDGSDTQHRIVL